MCIRDRSLAVGGIAIVNACKKIVEKGKRVTAKMLEANPEDVEFKTENLLFLNQIKRKQ